MAQIVTITNPLTGQPAQVDQLDHTAQEIDDAIARALPGGEIDITLQQITGGTDAAEYSATATYAIGDYCTHDGKLYRCTTAITEPEAWTEAHWTETTVGAELTAIYTALQNKADTSSVYTKIESDTLLQNKIDASSGAGAHNAIYRGKYLGSSVTSAQYAAISAGTFDDLYIGDYWTIGGVNYRIAAFDYYYRSGDNIDITTHHVTLVPDGFMYSHVMNDTNTTEGGYIGSKMKTSGLDQAVTTINNAFGSAHILTRREVFTNAVSNGKPSGGSWYDSTVDLMTEQNVYGSRFFAPAPDGTTIPHQYVVDKSQYPLFAFRPDLISKYTWYWLRDVVSDAHFAYVADYGSTAYGYASASAGVRPAFSIKA